MKVEVGFDNFTRLPIYNSRILRQIFQKYDELVIFDIGACEGEDSIRYARFSPLATIHSFEPVPENYKIAKENIRRHGLTARIKLNKLALSDKVGLSKIYRSSGQPTDIIPAENWDYGNKSSSLLPPKKVKEVTPWLDFNSTISTQTDTLKKYCKSHSLKRIDLIHLDVQGAELMVLKGAGNFIENVSAIWLEAETVELYHEQPLKDTLVQFLNEKGFVKIVDTVDDLAGDMLFVRPELARIHNKRTEPNIFDKLYIRKKSLIRIEPENVGFTLYAPENHKWMFSENTYYEKNVAFWLERIFDYAKINFTKPVFYDVGGNSGYYSLLASPSFWKVYTFEPSINSGRVIDINFRLNKVSNCVIQPYGLSDSCSVKEFHTYSSSGNDSLIKRNIPEGHELKETGTTSVTVKTIDSLRDIDVAPPHVIKIDVEGAELFVLKGGERVIEDFKPTFVIEYSEGTSTDAGYDRSEIIKKLKQYGYTIYGLDEDNVSLDLLDIETSKRQISNIIAIHDNKLEKWLKLQ